jgi:hypothetical protein
MFLTPCSEVVKNVKEVLARWDHPLVFFLIQALQANASRLKGSRSNQDFDPLIVLNFGGADVVNTVDDSGKPAAFHPLSPLFTFLCATRTRPNVLAGFEPPTAPKSGPPLWPSAYVHRHVLTYLVINNQRVFQSSWKRSLYFELMYGCTYMCFSLSLFWTYVWMYIVFFPLIFNGDQ